jgi:hypothetical protein
VLTSFVCSLAVRREVLEGVPKVKEDSVVKVDDNEAPAEPEDEPEDEPAAEQAKLVWSCRGFRGEEGAKERRAA